jgi:uncharacterized protein (TIGR02145 family)
MKFMQYIDVWVKRFTALVDTPSSYTGAGGKVVKVKSDASGLEFADESGGDDEKVKYDAGDPTAGYLADKIAAGTGIGVTEGTGANENKVMISISGLCDLIVLCPGIQDIIDQISTIKEVIEDQLPISFTSVKYGLLYNHYAVVDARNISADGWSVATKTQWDDLVSYLGTDPGDQLKESGATYWGAANDGTNSSGFSARGNGGRSETGTFEALNLYGYTWTQSLFTAGNAWSRFCERSSSNVPTSARPYAQGKAVRLIKDTTTLSDGDSGTYIGNDGKVYPTICIGTQEWIACNLAETKYRNGDSITEETDATSWAALTDGAMCAYDNDWDNV